MLGIFTAQNLYKAYNTNGVARWKLNNSLIDSFGSYTLTNNGSTFLDDYTFPLGYRKVAICDGFSYASFNPTGLPSGTSSRTLMSWIKTNTSNICFALGYGSSSSGNEIGIGVYSDGRPYVENYGGEVFGTGNIADNNWHHVAVTYNSTSIKIYIDAVLNNSGSLSLNTTLTWGNIGGIRDGSNIFTGSVADCRIYNAELSLSDISYIYNGERL